MDLQSFSSQSQSPIPEPISPKSWPILSPSLIIGGLLLLLLVGAGGFYLGKTSTKPSITPTPTDPQEKGCTMEAKICPDGTAVGRAGPNCEFAPCPTQVLHVTQTPTQECGGWNTSGETICECTGKIIKPTCPPNVVCDGGSYICNGLCGKCCFKGIIENPPYPKCSE